MWGCAIKGLYKGFYKRILWNCKGIGWSPGEGYAGKVLKIIDKRQIMPRLEQGGDGVLLVVADFEGEQAVWFEGAAGLGNEVPVDVEAGFAGEESSGGFVVAHLGVEGVAFGFGDVGRIADDGGEG